VRKKDWLIADIPALEAKKAGSGERDDGTEERRLGGS